MTLKYGATTLTLLALVALYSLAWAELRFQFGSTKSAAKISLPAILLTPLVIAASFRLLGWDLIFPPAMLSSSWELGLHAFVPALILFSASGLGASISSEVAAWKKTALTKPFHRTRLAFGLAPEGGLHRLVVKAALVRSWQRALPWVFSELIVLECLFNAPGLGWDVWQRAKERRLGDLTEAMVILLILFGACHLTAGLFSRRLGRRLEGYL